MTDRKEFDLTEEDYETLLKASEPVPYIIIGNMIPRSPQERANDAWQELGKKMGFHYMTVKPGNSRLKFTAIPKEE